MKKHKSMKMKGARPSHSVMGMGIGDGTGKNTGKASQVMPSKSKGKK